MKRIITGLKLEDEITVIYNKVDTKMYLRDFLNFLNDNLSFPVPEAETLAQTLVKGNTTGGTDIVVSDGDKISFNANAEIYYDTILSKTVFDNKGLLFSFEGTGNYQMINNVSSLGIGESPDSVHKVRITSDGTHIIALRTDISHDGAGTYQGISVRSTTPKTNPSGSLTYGVYANLTGTATAGTHEYIAGSFRAVGATTNYAIQLQDGTEAVNRVLAAVTADGKANWVDISTLLPADANSIYSGNGTVPSSVVATVTDTLTFTHATQGDLFTIDPSTSKFGAEIGTTGNYPIELRHDPNLNPRLTIWNFNGTQQSYIQGANCYLKNPLFDVDPGDTSTKGFRIRTNNASNINVERFTVQNNANIAYVYFANANVGINTGGAINADFHVVGTNNPTAVIIDGGSSTDILTMRRQSGGATLYNFGMDAVVDFYALDTSGGDLINDSILNLNAKYWDGAASQTVTATIKHWMRDDAPTPLHYLLLKNGSNATLSIDKDGHIAVGGSDANGKFSASALDVYGITGDTYCARFNSDNGDFDFVIEGSTLANLFYVNAGLDKIGINTNAPTSILSVNGDIETLTSTQGVIVKDRTNGNRYRIYTDGGVLNTELA